MVRPPSLPPLPGGQGHTFFADNAAAFAALPPAEQAAAAAREGWCGLARAAGYKKQKIQNK